MNTEEIQKNDILNLNFPAEDVLKSPIKKKYRHLQLNIAAQTTKWTSSRKLEIVFKSLNNGLKSVKTDVAYLLPDHVVLSGGYLLPVNAICEIEPWQENNA